MSSLGANYSADPALTLLDVTPAASATVPVAPGAKAISELNASPTCIVLDAPFAMGDLEPGVSYPHVYITTLYLNGPALSMTITYEIGTMANGWNPASLVPTRTLRIEGAELVPFFAAKGAEPSEASTSLPLWDQVEGLMYMQVQAHDARCAGAIETVRTPAPDAPSEPST